MKLGVLAVAAAMAAGVALAGERGKDETGEYWQSDDGVKHYYVFWDASTSAYDYNFSWTREDAAASKNTYGSWKNQIDGPIWTFGTGIAWPGSRYIGSFSVYGFHFESPLGRSTFRFEQENADSTMNLGAYGIRSEANDFSLLTYSTIRRIHLTTSQTWSGPEATALSSHPFYIVFGSNLYKYYIARLTADDDVTLTLAGDMVYSVLDYGATNDFSNADIVIKSPAILAHAGYWKDSQWRASYLKARSITIDGGAGIYFGKRATNASGETIALTTQPMTSDPWNKYGALGSAPLLSPDVASTIILKNGATLTAESETTVSGGVKIVVPAGETAYLKGSFKFTDNLTEIELGEGAFLDISEATVTGSGSPTVTGKGTFGPDSARSGTDEKGDWYIGNSLKKSYFLYQGTFTGTRWSLNGNSYTRKGAQEGSGAVNWVADSIFTLEKDTDYSGAYSFGGSPIVCGFSHEAPVSVKFEGGQVFYLGAYGIRATSNNKKFHIYSSRANPILTASQTWTGPAATELSATPYVINIPYVYNASYTGTVAARDDVTLTLAGDMVLSMKTYTNDLSNADVIIEKPAVLSLPKGAFGTGRLKARTLTIDGGAGIYFGKNTDVAMSGIGSEGNAFDAYGIGSYALISPEQVAPVVKLKGEATLTAKETTTVEGGVAIVACAGATAAFRGAFNLADDRTVLRVEADATLDLSDCAISGGAFSIDGDGTVRINLVNLTAPFTVDPATKVEYVVAGEGRFFMSDEKLALMSGDIVVEAGTLMIENAASIPPVSKIVTTAESALLLIDATGFDAESMMGGTKNLVDEVPLVVTEKSRTGVVAVGAGQTLEIWGNGLGESAEVTLGDGATVKFFRTATVGANMTSGGAANFTTAGGAITGTLAGTYVASSASGASGDIYVKAESGDRLVVDGDWTINDNGGISFYMTGGEVEVHSTVICKTTLNFREGHIRVCDGGVWNLSGSWINYALDSQYQTGPCCLEAGTNGTISVVNKGNNCYMHLGGANSKYESKLLLSGGKYEHGYDTFNLNKNGTVEIADGELVLYNPFKANGTAENSKVVLCGGKLDATSDRLFNGDGSATVHVDGHGTIVLPWGSETMDVLSYTDSKNESTACRWTCTPGSVLTIPGHANGRLGVFTMHNFAADGLVFDLNVRKTQVVLEGLGETIGLGWVLPGASVAKVTAANAAAGGQPVTTLNPSYVVPAGQTFDAGNPPTGWYEGFVEGSLQNLTFEEGSTFLFPYFGSGAALALGGKLTLPPKANYRVDAQGPKTKVEGATILTAEDGIDGDCSWTCVGGISRRCSQLVSEDDSLVFSYDPLGALLMLR